MSRPLLNVDKRLAESGWFLGRMSRVAFGFVCPPESQPQFRRHSPLYAALTVTSDLCPSLCSVAALAYGTWFKLPHATVVVCEPTLLCTDGVFAREGKLAS